VLSAGRFEVRLHDSEDRVTLSHRKERVVVLRRKTLERLRDLLTPSPRGTKNPPEPMPLVQGADRAAGDRRVLAHDPQPPLLAPKHRGPGLGVLVERLDHAAR